jgi:hypothetical protein
LLENVAASRSRSFIAAWTCDAISDLTVLN